MSSLEFPAKILSLTCSRRVRGGGGWEGFRSGGGNRSHQSDCYIDPACFLQSLVPYQLSEQKALGRARSHALILHFFGFLRAKTEELRCGRSREEKHKPRKAERGGKVTSAF